VLGHRPDEFGLVPESEGFVTYKELIQAIHEEPDWRYVTRSHINEVLAAKDRALFQDEETRIRVLERKWTMNLQEPTVPLPKILFTAVRKKAHPVVMEKGLRPAEGKYVVLSPDRDMVLRIGRRRDQEPVLLEVTAGTTKSEGVPFYSFGTLFLSPHIPARCISGPPVSKEAIEALREKGVQKEKGAPRPPDFTPGSFVLDIFRDPDPYRRAKGKKRKSWKEKARKMRRNKHR